MAGYEDWKALAEREQAFEKLLTMTAEGLAVQPLYTQTAIEPGVPGAAPFVRGGAGRARPFAVCMRVDAPEVRRAEALAEDLDGGADALWVDARDGEAIRSARERGAALVIDGVPPGLEDGGAEHWIGVGWLDSRTRDAAGGVDPRWLDHEWAIDAAQAAADAGVKRSVRVSTLAAHDAGADAADELAIALATALAYLHALTDAGISVGRAVSMLWFQIAIGRDTFGELCKLRALRLVGHKLFAACGAPRVPIDAIHAVCSARTLAQRDPWVNMLRVTTQVFAAALGGAQRITPVAFDAALSEVSAQSRRAARNTALVLREESHLGRVLDAAGGAYYIEERTDALAREAWTRFQQIERDGGIVALVQSGALRERLAASWAKRAQAIARRKEPVLGVSEFANVGEQLPSAIPAPVAPPPPPALIAHRDAEGFEALRGRVEQAPPRVALVTLGPPAEHRARLGYAQAFFATAGIAAVEGREGDIAVLCGSDERYAVEAVSTATELRAAGVRTVVLAGRPGALEAELRAAGVTGFLFVGCDVLATLAELLGGAS